MIASPPLNLKVGYLRRTMICAGCLGVRQHYLAHKKNKKNCMLPGLQQRFALISCTAPTFVLFFQ